MIVTRQVPNPLEWSRSFYLYYQAIFATGYEAASVRNHIQAFLEKGRVIRNFVNKYSSGAFIAAVAARHKALATQFIEILNENFKGLLTQNQYYLYEYLLSTVDNSKYTSYKSLYEFSHLADPYANNFLITQANSLVDNKRISGYSTSFNIMKAMKILNKLELLEPHNPVSKVYPHPVINFTLSHSKLKFKNSPLGMVYHNIEPNAHQDFRSTFIAGKDESDVVAIRGGSASTDFQRVLKDVNVPENYWKVFPGKRYQEKPAVNKEIDFLDYFRNEIIHAELKKRAKIINDLVIRESEILRQNETLVNQLDSMGFLLSSALTLLNYKRQTASTFSYIQRSNGINNSMKPHKPSLAFARDIFANYVGLVSRDVHNDYLPEDRNERQFWTFKNSFNHRKYAVPTREELNIKEYQLSGFGKGNALLKLDQQTEQLLAIEGMDENVGNYNVERLIGEAEAYLKVTNVG